MTDEIKEIEERIKDSNCTNNPSAIAFIDQATVDIRNLIRLIRAYEANFQKLEDKYPHLQVHIDVDAIKADIFGRKE